MEEHTFQNNVSFLLSSLSALSFSLSSSGHNPSPAHREASTMDRALQASLSSKPFIKGMLCADANGLLISGTSHSDPHHAQFVTSNSHHLLYFCFHSFIHSPTNPFIDSFVVSIFPHSANGELKGNLAGRFASIAHQAALIHADQPPPTVLIETRDRKVLVKDYDSMTIALRCLKQD